MFIIGKIIIFIIALIGGIIGSFLSSPYSQNSKEGGSKFKKMKNHWIPKDFINALDNEEAFLIDDKQIKITDKNFNNLIGDGTKELEFFLKGKGIQVWRPYKNVFNAPPEAIQGKTTFLMTPWLRKWQLNTIPDILDFSTLESNEISLFDIGCGTGRSLNLWKQLNAEVVNGVEPNPENIKNLAKKNLSILGKVLPTGGEDFDLISKEFPSGKTDIVLMSYSLTFFVKDKLDSLVKTINFLTHPGSYYIGIGMDGQKIKTIGKNKSLDNPVFSITMKDPKEDLISITMKNKFTLVQDQNEFLVDIDKFLDPFTSDGWNFILQTAFRTRILSSRFG